MCIITVYTHGRMAQFTSDYPVTQPGKPAEKSLKGLERSTVCWTWHQPHFRGTQTKWASFLAKHTLPNLYWSSAICPQGCTFSPFWCWGWFGIRPDPNSKYILCRTSRITSMVCKASQTAKNTLLEVSMETPILKQWSHDSLNMHTYQFQPPLIQTCIHV